MSDKDKPDVPPPAGPLKPGPGFKSNDLVSYGHDSIISTSSNYIPNPFEVMTSHPKNGSADKHTVEVKGNMVVEDSNGNKIDIGESLAQINKRLAILQPDPESLEKFEALKDLYEQYKMMEKLLMEGSNGKTDLDSD